MISKYPKQRIFFFKIDFINNIFKAPVGSAEAQELQDIFNDDKQLRHFASSFTVQNTVIDNQGSSKTLVGGQGALKILLINSCLKPF